MRRYRLKRWGKRRYRKRKFKIALLAYMSFILILTILALILKYPFRDKDNEYERELEDIKRNIVINKMERSEAYKRGMDMINYVWEYVPERVSRLNGSQVELPSYLKSGKSQRVSGIPYCWGGYLSLDISNKNGVKNFQEAISKGYVPGNVLTEGGYKENTAGLDCSGFVSAVFNLPEKYSTQTLKDYFKKINIKDIKPMDIFNCEKHHTFIFLRETSDKKGIITMESTTNKNENSRDKTIINYRSWDNIKKGIDGVPYLPLRYKGIIDDDPLLFKDINEFNDSKSRAVAVKNYDMYTGTIDYVDDLDYFKLIANKNKSVSINILAIPKNCTAEVVDNEDNIIQVLNEVRVYTLDLKKGNYFIKFSGKDLKFNGEDEFIFYVGG